MNINETSGGGWTCDRCGRWVPSGVTHICGAGANLDIDPVYPMLPLSTAINVDDETKAILRRIATALEVLAGLDRVKVMK